MKILKAEISDVRAIAPLFVEYLQFYKCEADLPAAHCFLNARIKSQQSIILFAEEKKKVLGFIQLYPSFSSLSMKPLWILNDLFVIPSARRKAIGRKLLIAAQKFSKETNSKGLTLQTAKQNLPARKLYESLGWKLETKFITYTQIS